MHQYSNSTPNVTNIPNLIQVLVNSIFRNGYLELGLTKNVAFSDYHMWDMLTLFSFKRSIL